MFPLFTRFSRIIKFVKLFFLTCSCSYLLLVLNASLSNIGQLEDDLTQSLLNRPVDALDHDKLIYTEKASLEKDSKFNQDPSNIYSICTYGLYTTTPRADGKPGENREPYTWVENRRFEKCKYSNCRFEPIQYKADVVIAEALEMNRMYRTPRIPRLQGQLWILNTREPPMYMQRLPWNRLENQFHLINSYRSSSDIQTPYGRYEARPEPMTRKPDIFYFLPKKTKMVAWFVSNCEGQSDRMRYVNELKKYIQVDIYGKCGNLTCEHSDFSECR